MKNKKLLKLSSLVLVIVLSLTIVSASFAITTNQTVYANVLADIYAFAANGAFVRVGSIPKGASAVYLGKGFNNLAYVKYGSITGYVYEGSLSENLSSPWDFGSGWGYPNYNIAVTGTLKALYDATVRRQATRDSTELGTIKAGTMVPVYGKTGDWYIIAWNSEFAYVFDSYFETGSTPPVTDPTAETVKATASVNVRSGPGTGYSIVGALQKGESAAKLGISGKWTMIRYLGQTAYVYSKYLTGNTVPGNVPSPASGIMSAIANVNVRKGPGTNYAKDGWLNIGDRVAAISTSGSWTKIEWKGGTAYVYSKYLKADTSGTPVTGGTKYAKANTYVYSGPGSNYAKLAMLYANQSVTAVGLTTGGWMQIIWNNGIGYVDSDLLTNTPFGYYTGDQTVTASVRRALVNTAAYKGAGTSTGTVVLIMQNELVSCTGVTFGNWMQISTANGYAFVAANCLSDALYSYPSQAPGTTVMRVKSDSLVFASPSPASANVVAMLRSGDQVLRVAILSDGWSQIKLSDSMYGYVMSSALE